MTFPYPVAQRAWSENCEGSREIVDNDSYGVSPKEYKREQQIESDGKQYGATRATTPCSTSSSTAAAMSPSQALISKRQPSLRP